MKGESPSVDASALLPHGIVAVRRWGRRELAFAIAAGAAAVVAGFVAGAPPSAKLVLLALGAVVAMALGIVALVRFEAFVVVLFVVRPIFDGAKLGDATPLGLDPSGALGVVLVVASLLWFADRPMRSPAISRPLRVALAVWLGTAALSMLGSPEVGAGAAFLLRMSTGVIAFMAFERAFVSVVWRRRALVAILVSTVVPMLVAVHQQITGSGVLYERGLARLRGTFTHSNPFSIFLTFVVILGVAVVPHVKGRARTATVSLTVAAALCLVGTYTRGAWVAAIIGVTIVAALQSRGLFAALVLTALAVLMFVPSVGDRLTDVRSARYVTGDPSNSLAWRLDYWREALRQVPESPVVGSGLDTFRFRTTEALPPHNDFVRSLVETGVLGLASYLAVIAAMVRVVVQALRRVTEPLDRAVAVASAGCVGAFVALNLSANLVSQVVLLLFLFGLLGMAAAAADEAERAGDAAAT